MSRTRTSNAEQADHLSRLYGRHPIKPDKIPIFQKRIDWPGGVPFVFMHILCLGVLWVGFSWVALAAAVALYGVRMFFITGFYHRYFSHKTFKTSRPFQFLMGALGCTALQCGPLWWAAYHRHHHANSDEPDDTHSPRQHGFFWSHMGWFMAPGALTTWVRYVKDWVRYPELILLDRFNWIVSVAMAAALFGLGVGLNAMVPSLGTNGLQMLVWGFGISTVALYHGTYTINSLAHKFGNRRFPTGDDSRNNFLLALITLGEGWHNNHHRYPAATRQGFYWWEIDLTWYGLWILARLGLIWDLKPVPVRVLEEGRARQAVAAARKGA